LKFRAIVVFLSRFNPVRDYAALATAKYANSLQLEFLLAVTVAV
jgi:hypothetical protein